MGAIANSVIQHGGKTIGVMPTFLQQRELAHNGLDELIIVNSMSERKEKSYLLVMYALHFLEVREHLKRFPKLCHGQELDKTKTLVFFITLIITTTIFNTFTIIWLLKAS